MGAAVGATALLALAMTAPGAQAADTACNLTISSGTTTGVTISSGTYTATSNSAVLNVSQLVAALESGAVAVDTASSGCTQTGTIDVSNAIDVTSGINDLTLTTAATGSISLGADATVGGALKFNNAVTLSAAVTLTAAVTVFESTLDGADNLTVSGGATFDADVGATTPLTQLSVSGIANLDAGTVTTSGSQTYEGAVTLDANVSATSTGAGVTFDNTVNGAQALTVSGQATFDAAVGATTALTSLTVDNASTLGSGISTSGTQSYDGAVTLGGNVTASSAAITFGSTVDGAHYLISNTAGMTSFDGAVGGTTALASLQIDGPATLDGNVSTSAGQVYKGAVALGADVTLSDSGESDITFDSTIDGADGLTVSTGGQTTFDSAVGGTTALTSLSVTGGQSDLDGGAVTTTGGQSYEAVALEEDITFSMGGNGSMIGLVAGAGGLIKEGAGTLTLPDPLNAYLDGTTIDAGLIDFSSDPDFGTGPITVNGGGLQWATGTTTDISSDPEFAGIGANGATFDTNGNNVTFASPLGGTGAITKAGLGQLTLSAVNTDGAATDVQAGSLDVTGTLPGAVTVESGATLNVTGTVGGAVTVESTGTLACSGGGTLAGGVTNNGGTATSVPGAPTGVTAIAGHGTATVSFTPGAANCRPLGSYTVTASPGGAHALGSGSPITVPGLTNGTSYTFTVTASNPIGTSAASGASNAVTPTAATSPPPPPVTTPALSSVRQSHAKWREAKKRKVHKPPVGTTFSFTLNEQAQVTFSFSRLLPGRKAGGRCVAPTRHNRHKPACKRTVLKGTLTVAGHVGVNTLPFHGKLSSGKLPPGRYRVELVASASGKTSSPSTLTFTIAPR